MLRISLVSLYCVAAVLIAANEPSADVVSETILASADVICDDMWADTNRGTIQHLTLRQPWPTLRGYISFDTSMIPHGSLRRATLSVYVSDGAFDSIIDFHRTPFAWDESTLTWNTQPAPFAEADAYDSLTPLFSWHHTALEVGWHDLVLFDDTTDYWESSANYSFALIPTQDEHDIMLYSRESAYAPHINVEYTDGATVPEPATLALMGLGLGGLILKRRRGRA